jgi:hypothetical protein
MWKVFQFILLFFISWPFLFRCAYYLYFQSISQGPKVNLNFLLLASHIYLDLHYHFPDTGR